MKWAIIVVRTLLGLIFLAFGVHFFVNFIPLEQPKLTDSAASFMQALYPSGYLRAVKVFEIAGGLLLVSGFLVPLGLTLLTPVIVNILFFELFLMQAPGIGVAMMAMALFLIYGYWPYFKAVFTLKPVPMGS